MHNLNYSNMQVVKYFISVNSLFAINETYKQIIIQQPTSRANATSLAQEETKKDKCSSNTEDEVWAVQHRTIHTSEWRQKNSGGGEGAKGETFTLGGTF